MKLKGSQEGFTLIETLVVIALLGAIGGVMSMTIITIMNISAQSNDHVIALRQVQNAGHWISRDTEMALTVVTTKPGVFLSIQWDDWGGSHYEVDYVFEGDKLKRQLNGSPGILIAQYIVESDFDENPDIDNQYKLTIKACHGEVEVERTYEITPRPSLH